MGAPQCANCSAAVQRRGGGGVIGTYTSCMHSGSRDIGLVCTAAAVCYPPSGGGEEYEESEFHAELIKKNFIVFFTPEILCFKV